MLSQFGMGEIKHNLVTRWGEDSWKLMPGFLWTWLHVWTIRCILCCNVSQPWPPLYAESWVLLEMHWTRGWSWGLLTHIFGPGVPQPGWAQDSLGELYKRQIPESRPRPMNSRSVFFKAFQMFVMWNQMGSQMADALVKDNRCEKAIFSRNKNNRACLPHVRKEPKSMWYDYWVWIMQTAHSRQKAKLFLCLIEPFLLVPRRNRTGPVSDMATAWQKVPQWSLAGLARM